MTPRVLVTLVALWGAGATALLIWSVFAAAGH